MWYAAIELPTDLSRGADFAGSTQKAQLRAANQSGNALFLLIMANLAVFLFDHVLNQGWTKLLYLNHTAPRWWQFITSAFSHGSWQHLSSNLVWCCLLTCDVPCIAAIAITSGDLSVHDNTHLLQFGLYVFGREVETDGGALGVTATYLVTAVGALWQLRDRAPVLYKWCLCRCLCHQSRGSHAGKLKGVFGLRCKVPA
jgi:membrane associated rhomboid family serine protease